MTTRLLVLLGIFVVAAAPLALYSWHVLSEVLSGRSDLQSAAIAVGFGATFAILAASFGRILTHVGAERE